MNRPAYTERLLAAILAQGGPSLRELRSQDRSEPLASWRHAVIWVLRTRSLLGVCQIGRLVHRNHSLVAHAVDRLNHCNGDARLRWIKGKVLDAAESCGGMWAEWLEDWSV